MSDDSLRLRIHDKFVTHQLPTQSPLKTWGGGRATNMTCAVCDADIVGTSEIESRECRRPNALLSCALLPIVGTGAWIDRNDDACVGDYDSMRAAARLQATYAGSAALQLGSITVDPAHDGGARLARYAERYGADPSRWLFLTGPRDVIYRLAADGFHQAAVAAHRRAAPPAWTLLRPASAFAHEPGGRIIQLAHRAYFAVVDREARIIGYFDSLDAGQMHALRSMVDRVVAPLTH